MNSLVEFMLVILVLSTFFIIVCPNYYEKSIKKFVLFVFFIIFICSLGLWILFDESTSKFQFVSTISWLSFGNCNCIFGVDGISLMLILLTTLLFPLCLIASWNNQQPNLKLYLLSLIVMEGFLIAVFCVLDLFLFYIFFEGILIPMFIFIGIWGSRQRKIRAAYLFFLYTLLGSLIMLLGILYIYIYKGSTNYEILLTTSFTFLEEIILWLTFFASFATKVPMIPLHIWLPEAHVEAPTSGSVILAGILLKLGSYGFLRFSLPLFPNASYFFTPLVITLSVLGILYASLTAIRQTDLKKIIAYASVAHMNLVILGLFSFMITGLEGALLQSISHGFVSSALFLCIGIIYDRYHSRLIHYYSGFVHVMPITMIIFLFFTMANIGLPGTSSFVGEFLILVGVYQFNTLASCLGALGMILGGGYSLWVYNRFAYGNLKVQYIAIHKLCDIYKNEFFSLIPLILGTLIMGIYPEFFLQVINVSITNLLISLISNLI